MMEGRRVLQLYDCKCNTMQSTFRSAGVLYLTLPQLAVRDDASQYVAVTSDPSEAWTVAVGVL